MATAPSQPPLFVKSYFADSVEDTLDRARVELGPDALLLNEREAPPESRHLGAFEVVFGVRPSVTEPARRTRGDALVDFRQRVRDLRQAGNHHRSITCQAFAGVARGRSVVEEHLLANGVWPELAAEIDGLVQERMRTRAVVQIGRAGQPWNAADLVAETRAAIEARFEVAPELSRVSVFIGAPGVGKTTALVKLALMQGLAAGRKVRLIAAGDPRIGARAQFEAYAAILGVDCAIVSSAAALAEAIDSTPADTLALIDTLGLSAAAIEENGRDWIDVLSQCQAVDAHLVLTASMREVDIRRTVDSLQAFRPAKLLFTRLDETEAAGSMFSEAARTGLPLSFCSTGSVIPEDLAPATKDRVVRALVRQLPQCIQART